MLVALSGCGILWPDPDDCRCQRSTAEAKPSPGKPAAGVSAVPPSSPKVSEGQAAPPPSSAVEPAPPPPPAPPPAGPPIALAPVPPAPAMPSSPPPAAAPPAPTALPGTAQYGAQLGAFRNRSNAERAWDRLKEQLGDLLARMPGPLLRDVDLGQKGRFTRVMAGPFTSQNAAQSLCLEVLARGGFCHVQRLGR
jgi:cell division septation protein DedD